MGTPRVPLRAEGRARQSEGRRRITRYGLVALCSLVLVLAACSDGDRAHWPDDMDSPLVISTGNRTGIYAAYGQEFGDVIEKESGAEVVVHRSGGSIDNLERLADGDADLAFSAADAAADAAAGRGRFDAAVPVRALARVYDDFLHLVVPKDSPIADLEDLRGRRVAIGAPDSGTALISHRLFRAAGIPLGAVDARALSLTESIRRLRAGTIDAFFWSGGVKTPALTEFARGFPFELVPLTQVVDRMRERFGSGYRHGTMPAGTYGLTEAVSTLAVPNMLVVRADADDDLVYALLDALFRDRDEIAEKAPTASLLDRAKAIFTSPIPLHPGAVRYYRDTVR